MEAAKKAKILRIYVSNTDKIKRSSVYESITFGAQRYGLAGATVYKGYYHSYKNYLKDALLPAKRQILF